MAVEKPKIFTGILLLQPGYYKMSNHILVGLVENKSVAINTQAMTHSLALDVLKDLAS